MLGKNRKNVIRAYLKIMWLIIKYAYCIEKLT
jgi:hypothetical protein